MLRQSRLNGEGLFNQVDYDLLVYISFLTYIDLFLSKFLQVASDVSIYKK